MDRRIGVHVDASDVVQDALVDAWRRMDEYLEERPLPFLAWLRQITHDRIIDTHRRHVTAKGRGINREIAEAQVSDASAGMLADRLFTNDTSPSNCLYRKEFHLRLREAIISLPNKDREVLLMRHIDQLAQPKLPKRSVFRKAPSKPGWFGLSSGCGACWNPGLDRTSAAGTDRMCSLTGRARRCRRPRTG